MGRKLIFSICLVLVLALVNGVWAAEIITWTNGDGDGDWCNQYNWSPDTSPPLALDTATIATPERGPIIGIDCSVDVGTIQGPAWLVGTDQVMDINTSGTVSVGAWTRDEDGSGTVTVNINGTPTITIGGDYWCLPDKGAVLSC
jgi:hypothetical protein